MERRSRSSVGSGTPGGRRRNLEEVAERMLHGRSSGGPRASAGPAAAARSRRSANNASAAAAAGVLGPAASPPGSRGSRGRRPESSAPLSAAATPPGGADGGRITPTGAEVRSEHSRTPNMMLEQVPVVEHRRSRLRDGGAALLAAAPSHNISTPLRLQRLHRGANVSSVHSAAGAASSGFAATDQAADTYRRSFGNDECERLTFEEADSEERPTFGEEEYQRVCREREEEFRAAEDSARDTFSSRGSVREGDDAEEDMSILGEDLSISNHERDRERELRARVRGLQRQLEAMQLATATLQAVVNQTSAQAESAQSGMFAGRGMGSPARLSRGRSGGAPAVAAPHSEGPIEDDQQDTQFHAHVTCDGCGMGPPLFGEVMKCMDCPDFDFCARCYADRERLGHPRGHRFVLRISSMPGGSGSAMSSVGSLGPLLSQGRGRMAGVLLRLLETELLHEALRQSTEGDGTQEESAEDKELRSAEVLSMLPRMSWYHPSEQKEGKHTHNCEECALCLEEYVKGEEVLKLPCRHLFHEGCLGPWFTKSLTCPLCKQEVTATAD